jgi:hypothetical protein
LHERAPYWLNGIVPLAYLLRNAGIHELAVKGIHKQTEVKPGKAKAACQNGTDMMYHDISTFTVGSVDECMQRCNATGNCVGWVVNDCVNPIQCWLKDTNAETNSASCRCYAEFVRPLPPVDLMAQARKYLDYMLSHAQPDGWLGPADATDGAAYWGRSNIMLAMSMLAEGERETNPALFANVTATMLNYMLAQKKRMGSVPMNSWASQRWMDMSLGAQWLLENAPQGQEAQLWEYIDLLAAQGSDWELFFTTFKDEPRGANHHNVNVAQALKSAAVLFRQNLNSSLPGLSFARMQKLDEMFGLPTGMFNGDEILPDPPTRNPSRGIELCGVVEAMYSYTTMMSIHGDLRFGDRAEKIAFNALPATWASPKGGDMWAHQYLQAINEINAIYADPHVWQNDGPLSETYGLEPNYGCCTANFNQGWPKLANMAVMRTNDTGAFVALLAPVIAKLPGGATVDISTAYPYEDGAMITCQTASGQLNPMPLYIRIPAWADGATINGQPVGVPSLSKQQCPPKGVAAKFDLRFQPKIRLEPWGDAPSANVSAYSVLRGPLLFSLPIGANYTVYGHHFGSGTDASNDYYLNPTTPWNFALDADPVNPSKSLQFVQGAYVAGDAPFNHSGWPVSVTAQVRAVPSWTIFQNSAAAPPASPACAHSNCGSPMQVRLVPHGGTELRVGELPLSGF